MPAVRYISLCLPGEWNVLIYSEVMEKFICQIPWWGLSRSAGKENQSSQEPMPSVVSEVVEEHL